MADKPLVFSDSADPSDVYDAGYADARERGRDPSWIPGYSEYVKARDLSKSDDLTESEKRDYYKRFGASPKEVGELPFEFRWVRVVDSGGGYLGDSARVEQAQARQKGYRPLNVDEIDTIREKLPGFELPPAAHEADDGTIRRLDTALWVVDGPRAKQNERQDLREAHRFEQNGPATVEDQGSFRAGSNF